MKKWETTHSVGCSFTFPWFHSPPVAELSPTICCSHGRTQADKHYGRKITKLGKIQYLWSLSSTISNGQSYFPEICFYDEAILLSTDTMSILTILLLLKEPPSTRPSKSENLSAIHENSSINQFITKSYCFNLKKYILNSSPFFYLHCHHNENHYLGN